MNKEVNYTNLFSNYNIDKVTADSRECSKGAAFFAIKGSNVDGHDYIRDAISRGCELVFVESTTEADLFSDASIIYASNTRIALAEAAASLYPKRPKYLMGVTGTNGKTTIAHLVRELIAGMGLSAASIGSEGLKISAKDIREDYDNIFKPSSLTTPDPVTLHYNLHKLAELGVEYVVLETSSHALSQERVGAVKFDVAAFSNISAEHLDYHPSVLEYFKAKSSLFKDHLDSSGVAVLNADTGEYPDLVDICNKNNNTIISIGNQAEGIKLERQYPLTISEKSQGDLSLSPNEVNIKYKQKQYSFKHYLLGEFQNHNLLMSLGITLGLGFKLEDLLSQTSRLGTPEGRMEIVENALDRFVIVDNSHKSKAMEQVLNSLRTLLPSSGKLWVVFGCGGERDKYKRPVLGEIASNLADKAIITDDNPRSENPENIRREIISSSAGAIEKPGRRSALEYAISNMSSNDILLVAGRGNEKYQLTAGEKIRFNDKEVIKEICQDLAQSESDR